MIEIGGFLGFSLNLGLLLVVVSLLLGFLRLAKGPTFSDRVVALDMMTVSLVTFCALFSVRTGATAFLDVAAVLALIGFLATVAFARFAERGIHHRRESMAKPSETVAEMANGETGETEATS